MRISRSVILIVGAGVLGGAVALCAGNAGGATSHAAWTAASMGVLYLAAFVFKLERQATTAAREEAWRWFFWFNIKRGATYTTAAERATGAQGAGLMFVVAASLVGAFGLFYTIGIPVMQLTDGADHSYCCSPLSDANSTSWVTSPDGRWLVLAGSHDHWYSKGNVSVMLIDLDEHRPVPWGSTWLSPTSHLIDVQDAKAITELSLHASAQALTVIASGAWFPQVSFAIDIPEGLKEAWVHSWRMPKEPKTYNLARLKNLLEANCGRVAWISANLKTAMLWQESSKHENHWYTLWWPELSERRSVTFRDLVTQREIMETRIGFLAPSYRSCSSGALPEQGTLLTMSNSTGNSWLILTDDYLKFLALPLSSEVSTNGAAQVSPQARTISVNPAAVASGTEVGCFDISRHEPHSLRGKLVSAIFAGRPGFADVRKGDDPEPGYILKLRESICLRSDDTDNPVDSSVRISEVQLFSQDQEQATSAAMRSMLRIRCAGTTHVGERRYYRTRS